MTWTLLLLTGLAVVLALTSPVLVPLLGSGFSPEKLAFTRSLLLMLLPILVLKGLATVWTAVLNASERFSIAAGIPIVTPAVTVALLVLTGHQWGIYTLVAGTVGGVVVETMVFIWHLRRLRIPITPRWSSWSPAIAEVTQQYGSVVAGAFLMSSTMLVDQAMGAMLGPGSVAALSYGGKVVSFVTVVGATALGTTVLPHFSRMVAVSDWQGIRNTVRTYIKWILLTTVPLMVAVATFSESLVRLIFQRGAFAVGDTEVVSRVQAFLILQLPFYVINILLVRLISSLKANSVLMWGCVINFIVNVVLNYVLMQWLQIAGIALSTSVVYLVSVAYLSVMLLRVLEQCEIQEAVQSRPAQMAG
jgi:putative peptidoglycan lipid II flippase